MVIASSSKVIKTTSKPNGKGESLVEKKKKIHFMLVSNLLLKQYVSKCKSDSGSFETLLAR